MNLLALALSFSLACLAEEPPNPSQFAKGSAVPPGGQAPAEGRPAPAPADLENMLAGALRERGVEGRVHAAILEQGVVLFQVTNPLAQGMARLTDFRIYPLRLSEEQLAALRRANLRRNDFITVRGRFASIPPHIVVSSVEVGERTQGREEAQNHELRQALELRDRTNFTLEVLVHASLREGRQLAVDYRGHILPVTLEDEGDAAARRKLDALWRFDIVRIPVKEVRAWPAYPPHLVFDAARDVETVESIRDFLNFDPERPDRQLAIEGTLVRIPPSSGLVTRESWGLQVQSARSSLSRQFLLWNFSDADLQGRVEERLRGWWEGTEGALVGRNRNIHPGVVVRARGTLPALGGPDQARNQGNHFFHVHSIDDVERVQPQEQPLVPEECRLYPQSRRCFPLLGRLRRR